jgi:FixJ family two-component response regulator
MDMNNLDDFGRALSLEGLRALILVRDDALGEALELAFHALNVPSVLAPANDGLHSGLLDDTHIIAIDRDLLPRDPWPLIATLRERGWHGPIIIMTERKEKHFESGVADHNSILLEKPFGAKHMQSVVDRARAALHMKLREQRTA